MGCASADENCEYDESPKHTVTLSAYKIQKYEVTNKQYKSCVDANVCTAPLNVYSNTRTNYYGNTTYDNYPVIYVSWENATTFCGWIGGRLPTEAEWEKAARGPSPREPIYPWGDNAPTCTLYACSHDNDTEEVGSHPTGTSYYGVMDMVGNVREWVSDWYMDTYYAPENTPSTNPQGPLTSPEHLRVVRSFTSGNPDKDRRISRRYKYFPTGTLNDLGFRCAQD